MNSLKFVYSEKATISTLLLSTLHIDISKVEISQNFVAFSEYSNFTNGEYFSGYRKKARKELKIKCIYEKKSSIYFYISRNISRL